MSHSEYFRGIRSRTVRDKCWNYSVTQGPNSSPINLAVNNGDAIRKSSTMPVPEGQRSSDIAVVKKHSTAYVGKARNGTSVNMAVGSITYR